MTKTEDGKVYLTVEEAARVLGMRIHSVYMILRRGGLKAYTILNKRHLSNEEVLAYKPKRKKMRSLLGLSTVETSTAFLSFEEARDKLNISAYLMKKLIKTQQIRGYCSPSGEVLVVESDIKNLLNVEVKDGEPLNKNVATNTHIEDLISTL